MTVAASPTWMGQVGPGPYCGRTLVATNIGPTTDNSIGGEGNTVTVTIEDTCEGCAQNDLDFSVAAWNALTNNAAYSVVTVSW